MGAKKLKILLSVLVVLPLVALTAWLTGGLSRTIGVPIMLLLTSGGVLVAWFHSTRPAASTQTPPEPVEPHIVQAEKKVMEQTTNVPLSVLGAAYRKDAWSDSETIVDTILDDCIRMIRARIDAHTVAIFFPTADGGIQIRRHDSRSETINARAIIYPGVGVLGSFLKDGLKQLKLEEILTDSITLHYYSRDAGIRSLMASPIVVDGLERGTIIVDSTQKSHFTDEDHAYLSVAADLVGKAVYYTYLYTEHRIDHARFAAMSATEKCFFQEQSVDAVIARLAEIISFAFTCDRMTISLRLHDTDTAIIKESWGIDADTFRGMSFSLDERTIANLAYRKNISFYRNFAEDHYEIRYSKDEPRNRELSSFLAYPIGVEECRGLILLESHRREAFSNTSRDLLSRLVTSAAVAIEKIQVFNQAHSLATHDGLTGLYNHRQFQQMLREAITRSARYKDPLALVICDIDFFKKVNDTWGHRFGDTVLKTVSAKLQTSIRQGIDSAARYGGEEFALILEKMDSRSAQETCERIRQSIAEIVFQTPNGKEINVTMSMGIAIYMQHARKQEALIQKADKALYAAKENGRNRVELYYSEG
jgi:diguanylate cyclase (GGDEF)-like protein